MRRWLRRLPARPDSGFSLIELSIAMGLLMVLTAMTLTFAISARRAFVVADDEATGQTDVRTAVERLGRDIRSGRGIDLGATASRLELWIDTDSDYRRETNEIVVWELQPAGDGQFNVLRAENGVPTVTAETIIDQLAFCYRVDATSACLPTPLSATNAERVRIVETTMRYDAELARGSNARNLIVVERLRNVG